MTEAETAAGHPTLIEPSDLPTGTVTMLFTDIEGSTRLLGELGDRYAELQESHFGILRAAAGAAGGVEFGTEGDAFFAAFRTPIQAVACAADAQRRIAAHRWPHGGPLRVRMGIHTGDVGLVAGGYVGMDVNIAARIAASAHGGQVVVSEATRGLVAHSLPRAVGLRDLGEHRLKDVAHAIHLYQLTVDGLTTEFPPLRTLDGGRRTNLPPERTSFVGRLAEQASLRELLGRSRLVTLIGTGGTGKTRLMLHVASHLVDRYDDGVWLAELAPLSDDSLVVPEVARAVGAVEEPGRPLAETLTDFLRAKSLLLLLDNCEHLVEAAAVLAESLFVSCPGLTVLATSREALGIEGEAIFQVPSLALPAALEPPDIHARSDGWLEDIATSEAVRLFVERARGIVPSFSVTASNAAHVLEICRRLDGIPLALELAAARLSVLSVEEVARGLSDRFRLLTGGRRTAVPRQQTLQALVDWSWDLLDEEDRALLRRLSVFVGGWTLDAAAAVTAEDGRDRLGTLDGLSRLVDRSLVAVERGDGGATRYRMLETIRQYARDRLVAAGEAAPIRARQVSYFLRLALEGEPALRGPEMIPWLHRLDAEVDNCRAALDWAFETDVVSALRLCVALKAYWDARAGAEKLERLRQAAEVAERMAPRGGQAADRDRAILVARVLAAAAQAHAVWTDATAGLAWAHDAVAIARGAGDVATLADALGALVLARIFAGQHDGLDALRDEALDAAHRSGNSWLVTMIDSGAAELDVANGDLDRARQRLEKAVEAAKRSGNPFALAFAALSQGVASGFVGDVDAARRWFAEAMARYEEMGDRRFVLIARSDLAHALRRGGALDEAEAVYRETLHEWVHVGNRGAVANQLECCAYLAQDRDDGERAVQLLAAAGAIRELVGAAMLPFERVEYEAALRSLREQLDPTAFGAAWAAGRRLSLDDAVALALARSPA
ncbi:MAG TPA: adenylate/guanylate cyclase domain-containing protein [Candidatus Limnocylindria bacterium]|nr:adenylate/guanylate cyclase domain-containing protein [Candidatus Limnocylindria bacterium]